MSVLMWIADPVADEDADKFDEDPLALQEGIQLQEEENFPVVEVKNEIEDTTNDIRSYQCDVCHEVFKQKSDLCRHLVAHISYKCTDCNLSFTRNELLNEHRKSHLEKELPSVPSEHIEVIHKEIYECSNCTMQFPDPNTFTRHSYNCVSKNPYVCFYCQKRYKTQGQLEVHMVNHDREQESSGPIILRRSKKISRSEIKDHMATERPLKTAEERQYHFNEDVSVIKAKILPKTYSRQSKPIGTNTPKPKDMPAILSISKERNHDRQRESSGPIILQKSNKTPRLEIMDHMANERQLKNAKESPKSDHKSRNQERTLMSSQVGAKKRKVDQDSSQLNNFNEDLSVIKPKILPKTYSSQSKPIAINTIKPKDMAAIQQNSPMITHTIQKHKCSVCERTFLHEFKLRTHKCLPQEKIIPKEPFVLEEKDICDEEADPTVEILDFKMEDEDSDDPLSEVHFMSEMETDFSHKQNPEAQPDTVDIIEMILDEDGDVVNTQNRKCPICKKSCRNNKFLLEHLRIQHQHCKIETMQKPYAENDNRFRFHCHICGEGYSSLTHKCKISKE